MYKRALLVLSCFSCLFFPFTQAQAAETPASAQSCVACHGSKAEGNQALKAPALAAQDAWYIENQLLAFQQGWRGTAEGDSSGASMMAISKSINTNEIKVLASFFNTLSQVSPALTLKGDALKGGQYYETLCGSCHGPAGKGNPSLNSPKLAGLNDWYIVEQIQKFQKGQRGYEKEDRLGRQMRMMASIVPDEQALKDIAVFLSQQ